MKTKYLINCFLPLSIPLMTACSARAGSALPTEAAQWTVEPTVEIQPTPTSLPIPNGYVLYASQSGDTIPAVAAHFGVAAESVMTTADLLDRAQATKDDWRLEDWQKKPSPDQMDGSAGSRAVSTAILDPGTPLYVKDVLEGTTSSDILFPDSEVVFSPSALDFDLAAFAQEQGGFLNEYSELMTRGTTPAVEIVAPLALEHSYNPRILLSIMELESGWVTGFPETDEEIWYPLGIIQPDRSGIYQQVGRTIRHLSQGYYGWRAGTLTELEFADGNRLRLSPYLNAGTVAVMVALAQIHTAEEWQDALYGPDNLVDIHTSLFGDMWARAATVEPLFPAGIQQPELNLPLPINQKWNYTCGPHTAWGREGPPAALDFAPPLNNPGCGVSNRWTTAAASGLVVRAAKGGVVIDLDGDGYEQTGWDLVYMHVANTERVNEGDWVEVDDPIGHPSCEGGSSSGIHVHIARKYNGEWVLADGGIPFVLSGYRAYNGEKFCEGTLVRGERTITADPYGNFWTITVRPDSDEYHLEKFLSTPTPRQ